MQTEHPETYLTTGEAAEYLGISRHTMAQWRTRDRGPAFVKVGLIVRYRRSDLDAWADSHRVRAGAAA